MEKSSTETLKIDYATNYTGTGVWYWCDYDDKVDPLKKYSEDLQSKIESSFREIHENSSLKTVVDGKNYTIFPLAGIQVNGLSGSARQVRSKVVEKGDDPHWEWKSEEGWRPYSDEMSFMINAAVKKLEQARTVEFTFNHTKYHIDLFNLIQTNTVTKYQREVTRKEN